MKYFIKRKSNVYCGFIDASKAFDKVLHAGLFVKLMRKGAPKCFINILHDWYSKLFCAVKWENIVTNSFKVLCGVRQGGVLSPLLYNIYVDELTMQLRDSKYGCYIGTVFTGAVSYADDLTVIAASLAHLQHMLDICEKYGRDWDIQFNPKKTSLVKFGCNNEVTRQIYFCNNTVGFTDGVKYLGVDIVAGNSFKCDLDRQKRKFFASANSILQKLGRQRNEVVAVELVKSKCIPILLYGCEIWNVSNTILKSLDVAQNTVFRKIFNVPMWESMREIYSYCRIACIKSSVNARELKSRSRLNNCQNPIFQAIICM